MKNLILVTEFDTVRSIDTDRSSRRDLSVSIDLAVSKSHRINSIHYIFKFLLVLFAVLSCRKDPTIIPPEPEPIPQQTTGFYLLNEGSMGRNNATLDYYDVASSNYYSDIFAKTNPGVVKKLGDVGNDLKIKPDKPHWFDRLFKRK